MRDLKLEIGNCIVGVLLVEVSSNGSGRSHSRCLWPQGGAGRGRVPLQVSWRRLRGGGGGSWVGSCRDSETEPGGGSVEQFVSMRSKLSI